MQGDLEVLSTQSTTVYHEQQTLKHETKIDQWLKVGSHYQLGADYIFKTVSQPIVAQNE